MGPDRTDLRAWLQDAADLLNRGRSLLAAVDDDMTGEAFDEVEAIEALCDDMAMHLDEPDPTAIDDYDPADVAAIRRALAT